jgi:subtilisin family serine protease
MNRQERVHRFELQHQDRKERAWAVAQREGWMPRRYGKNNLLELMALDTHVPKVLKTFNREVAISNGVNPIRDTEPFYLTGAGQIVGIWDGGAILATHQEFGDRVRFMDTVPHSHGVALHATHVAGTIGATGIHPLARGMAPEVRIESYDFDGDLAEVTTRAMSDPNDAQMLQVSNHSYGYVCGWDDSEDTPYWYGRLGDKQSYLFGLYDESPRDWDEIAYEAPYYLHCRSAGNDGYDQAPDTGMPFYYYLEGQGWLLKTYNADTDPADDGILGGYDTLHPDAVAKNVLTIGAVHDAMRQGQRQVDAAFVAIFSSWGPTNDGRIKPDLVAAGVDVFSTVSDHDKAYATLSGTSMSVAGVSGSAVLLNELYQQYFPGSAMRSSTLKGLLIHTADDLGPPGPDYQHGWGLINARAAANLIVQHHASPSDPGLVEDLLDETTLERTYTLSWNGQGRLRATLCWTDPPGPVQSLEHPRVPNLMNDLDLRLTDPNDDIYYPYTLNGLRPEELAQPGDNRADNVEQVEIYGPVPAGEYRIKVSYKDALTDYHQYYSLLVSVIQ